MPYVTDTHALIWHATGDQRLSPKAGRIFKSVDEGKDVIVVPCIVLFELLYLVEKGKIAVDFDVFVLMLSSSSNYRIEPLCSSIIQESKSIPRHQVPDPWDRLIVATSAKLGFPLITRDRSLRKAGLDIVW